MIIGVVCHDAGGAEILASYCYRKNASYVFSIKGPALGVFQRKFGNFENVELEVLIDSVDELFTGTSGNSKFEIEAIRMAKKKGSIFLNDSIKEVYGPKTTRWTTGYEPRGSDRRENPRVVRWAASS